MIGNFNGGIIDASSVVLIINKLKLYIENEEMIIENIKNSLHMLDSYYFSDNNNKSISNKKNNLYDALNTMNENKKMYVEYLEFMVNSYVDKDNKQIVRFQKDIN